MTKFFLLVAPSQQEQSVQLTRWTRKTDRDLIQGLTRLAWISLLLLNATTLFAQTTGQALFFDGTNDYITIPANSSISGTNDRTSEAWIKTTVGGTIMEWGVGGSGTRWAMRISTTTGKLEIGLGNAAPAATSDLRDGQWHHVAVTKQRFSNGDVIALYVDGVQEQYGVLGGTTLNTTPNSISIGAGISSVFFNGEIDEVRLWNTARTATEIATRKACQLIGTETGLVAYYRFNQGNAGSTNTDLTTLTNVVGNGFDGTLTNFALTGPTSNWVSPGGVSSAALCISACNTVVHVTPTGNGTNNGSSWANALAGSALVPALVTACSGTTFLVGAGLYVPGTNRDDSFNVASGVEVYGGYTVTGASATRGAVDPVNGNPSSTTFSGEIGASGGADNSKHVVVLTTNTLLDGIVITGGYASRLGGGIYNEGGSFTLANASVVSNTALAEGGGIFSFTGTVNLQNTVISQNQSDYAGGGISTPGGALMGNRSLLSQNRAATWGGAVYVNGNVDLTLTNTTVSGNVVDNGAAHFLYTTGTLAARLTSCSITQNTTLRGNAGIYVLNTRDATTPTTLTMVHTLVADNNVVFGAGGFLFNQGALIATISSSTFTQNSSGSHGTIFYTGTTERPGNTTLTMTNTEVSRNRSGVGAGGFLFIDGNGSLMGTVTSCSITQNSVSTNGVVFYLPGGGANLTMNNTEVSGNHSVYDGAGALLYSENLVSVNLSNCRINQNSVRNNGGVIYAGSSTTPMNLTMTNTEVARNQSNNSTGGFAYVENGLNARITSCSFTQNTANTGGGVFYVSSGPANLTLTGSTIEQNAIKRNGMGGGLYLGGGGTGQITDTRITQNTAVGNGGGIYLAGRGSFLIANSQLTGNVSLTGNGGAVYANLVDGAGSLTALNCQFSQNQAITSTFPNGRGGGVFNQSNSTLSPTVFQSCTFTANRSGQYGGAMYNSGGAGKRISITVTNSVFQSNTTVARGGGAIYNDGTESGTCVIGLTSTLFDGNLAVSSGGFFGGGAIFNDGGYGLDQGKGAPSLCQATVQSCTFTANQSEGYGPGAAVYNSGYSRGNLEATFTNCVFRGNTTSGYGGGAIYNDGSYSGTCTVGVTGSLFADNQAQYGGAIYNDGSHGGYQGYDAPSISSPVLQSCTFTGNQASADGGVLYNDGSSGGQASPLITNCVFQSNTALTKAGAIYSYASGSGTSVSKVVGSVFRQNSAAQGGGAFYGLGGSFTLVNCTLNRNQTTIGGTVFSGESGATFGVQNSIVWNNAPVANNFSGLPQSAITLQNSLIDPTSTAYTDGGNNKTLDPLFVDEAGGNLRLTASSPAVDAGNNTLYTAISAPATDLVGQTRPTNTTVDMGAYELAETAGSLSASPPASLNLNVTGCPAELSFIGTGKRFVVSGPGQYGATRPLRAVIPDVLITIDRIVLAGQYTITVTGNTGQPPYTTTFLVTGTCP